MNFTAPQHHKHDITEAIYLGSWVLLRAKNNFSYAAIKEVWRKKLEDIATVRKALTVYQYDDLSEGAQEAAREWFLSCSDGSDLDYPVDHINDAGNMLGIEFDTRQIPLVNGTTRPAPKIWYNVAYGQGDGVSFDARYSYKKGALAAIKKERPTDNNLAAIAQTLQNAQRPHFYHLEAGITSGHNGHFLIIEVSDNTDWYREIDNSADDIEAAIRDFASWAYGVLRDEVEYQHSDETVAENIRCNEYEFEENGSII